MSNGCTCPCPCPPMMCPPSMCPPMMCPTPVSQLPPPPCCCPGDMCCWPPPDCMPPVVCCPPQEQNKSRNKNNNNHCNKKNGRNGNGNGNGKNNGPPCPVCPCPQMPCCMPCGINCFPICCTPPPPPPEEEEEEEPQCTCCKNNGKPCGKCMQCLYPALFCQKVNVCYPLDKDKPSQIKGGVLLDSCICDKRNGLQDECPFRGCGIEQCKALPDPMCWPGIVKRLTSKEQPGSAPPATHLCCTYTIPMGWLYLPCNPCCEN